MPARLASVHPVLGSTDVAASLDFYRRLGFDVTFVDRAEAPSYAAVSRDAVTLHLQWHEAPMGAEGEDRPTYRFVCLEVDELYEAFRMAGVTAEPGPSSSPYAQPADTPWGTREFHVHDPDRNGLQFYRPL